VPVIRILVAAVAAAAVVAAPVPAAPPADGPYTLTAHALVGGSLTDLYLTVASDGAPLPERLEKVQVKALPFGGDQLQTTNHFDVAAPGGVAVLHLTGLARGRPLHVLAHVKEGEQWNVEAETSTDLRPNLTVGPLAVPADIVRRHPFTVSTTLTETGGDTGASAIATLLDATTTLAVTRLDLAAGSSTTVSFETMLGQAGRHGLRVVVSDASPAEWNLGDDEAARAVDVFMYTSNGVVSTDHRLATKVGEEILRAGGNAIDAAVAVQFALNVVDPNLNGIGGGTAVLVRLANGEAYAIDGRELAPHATTADMYTGKPIGTIGINGYSVGVPTTLLTVSEMLRRWGTMSLADVLAEPTRLADEGVPVGVPLAGSSREVRTLDLQPETIAAFRRPAGTPLQVDDTIVEHDLAKTFRLIAAHGVDGFYRGEVAQAIVDAQRRLSPTKPIAGGEGRMTLADLANAHVTVERPLALDFEGARVLAPPPSTNGGLVLLEALGVYQKVRQAHLDLDFGFATFGAVHTELEALRLAFADRDMWVGDDDAVDVPVAGLLSDGYLGARSSLVGFDKEHRIPVALAGDPRPYDAAAFASDEEAPPGHTTHFSIVDKWGNAVSMTTTLADSFGSGIMVSGYGFVLNDSLSLFNPTPKRDDATGNPGANDAAADKRPMGSMTPTMIVRDGEPILLTGTYGSAFIPSLVFNVVLNVLDHGMTVQQAVDAPRMWGAVPNVNPPSANFAWNPGVPLETIAAMRAIGDQIARFPTNGFGSTSSAGVEPATLDLVGASDRRQWSDPLATVIPR
jgi:gamma-glutamyltranspeptidase / glutathione hydrolase